MNVAFIGINLYFGLNGSTLNLLVIPLNILAAYTCLGGKRKNTRADEILQRRAILQERIKWLEQNPRHGNDPHYYDLRVELCQLSLAYMRTLYYKKSRYERFMEFTTRVVFPDRDDYTFDRAFWLNQTKSWRWLRDNVMKNLAS